MVVQCNDISMLFCSSFIVFCVWVWSFPVYIHIYNVRGLYLQVALSCVLLIFSDFSPVFLCFFSIMCFGASQDCFLL